MTTQQRMSTREPDVFNVPGVTGWRLLIGLYVVGYFVYLGLHMYWGMRDGIEPYLGFVAWHALLYGPLWPMILIARLTSLIIATV